MISRYRYTIIMDRCEYDYELECHTLPSVFFKDYEPDTLLFFSSRYAAHEFVCEELENE